MKGVKAAANSCRTTPTRRLTVEVDLHELGVGFRWFFADTFDLTQRLWESYWPVVKGCPSFTTRVNGRVLVKRQCILNKRVRAQVARMRKGVQHED